MFHLCDSFILFLISLRRHQHHLLAVYFILSTCLNYSQTLYAGQKYLTQTKIKYIVGGSKQSKERIMPKRNKNI